MNTSVSNRKNRAAFTLIELLTVIGIIAILAALILGGAGIATKKARISRTQAELTALETAIGQYQAHKGFYPPDNHPANSTVNPVMNSLFYELTGVKAIVDNKGAVTAFVASTGEQLNPNDVTTLFGTGGIVNSSSDASQPAENFMRTAAKTARTEQFYITGNSGATFTMFGVPVQPGPKGLVPYNEASTPSMTPWNYISSNPTNNPTSYDLWIDVVWGGRTNRISNWNKEPQPL